MGVPFPALCLDRWTQYSIRDLHEWEAFIRNLGRPPIPEEDLQLQTPTLVPKPLLIPAPIWIPVVRDPKKAFSTPQRTNPSRFPTWSSSALSKFSFFYCLQMSRASVDVSWPLQGGLFLSPSQESLLSRCWTSLLPIWFQFVLFYHDMISV